MRRRAFLACSAALAAIPFFGRRKQKPTGKWQHARPTMRSARVIRKLTPRHYLVESVSPPVMEGGPNLAHGFIAYDKSGLFEDRDLTNSRVCVLTFSDFDHVIVQATLDEGNKPVVVVHKSVKAIDYHGIPSERARTVKRFASALLAFAMLGTAAAAQTPDQSKPDQAKPDQLKPDQGEPDQAVPDQAKDGKREKQRWMFRRNAECRRRAGCRVVQQESPRAMEFAQNYAEYMARTGDFSHSERPWSSGENIAHGNSDPFDVWWNSRGRKKRGWLRLTRRGRRSTRRSPAGGHYGNMTSDMYTHAGFGYANGYSVAIYTRE